MGDLARRLRAVLLFAGLAAAALVLMVGDRRALAGGGRDLPWWSGLLLDLTIPVRELVAAPVDLVRGAVRHYVALLDVREENEALRRQIAMLQEENVQLREALVAGGQIRSILEMRDQFDIPMQPAQVAGQDVSPWFHSILLDRGRHHGLRSGMPVIDEHGVVGLLTATTPRASRAMLLLDRQSVVDGIVQRADSRARGFVRGTGGPRLRFELAIREADVRVGDEVVTSGLGGVFPKGLRIGTVVEVEEGGASLVRTARIEPAVDFGRLEQVHVMLWRSPTLELLHAAEEEAPPGASPPGS